ncbi:unnamed protein product [Musa acuminata subsp. burmannicoides]
MLPPWLSHPVTRGWVGGIYSHSSKPKIQLKKMQLARKNTQKHHKIPPRTNRMFDDIIDTCIPCSVVFLRLGEEATPPSLV